ncbi:MULTISPECIES: cupin domain-containing protein [Sphingobium]|uniref:Cupin domain-containing protein n=1 Tax=Sphingobium cupriresistens TaxID=1132417 RepID=A0A8G1ZIU8_9SPHN|nr:MULTISPECIES: cupin domain-containing protein [Sphingobium]MBJ7377146.1 cupin domain-containing protein [Sphingobium sp.]RYM12598.1 cupin domain-containing protein [Sphingobium cupriresistens]
MRADDERDGRALIERLGLAAHPEGGWYRETWRAESGLGQRAGGTTILFLLEAHERSHWHRVDADEHWFWHAGAPLILSIAPPGGPACDLLLGPDIFDGQMPQGWVPAHHWQASTPHGGWTLVSCTVTPGFDFAGFSLAPPDWSPPG